MEFASALKKKRKEDEDFGTDKYESGNESEVKMAPMADEMAKRPLMDSVQTENDSSIEHEQKSPEAEIRQTNKDIRFISKDMDKTNMQDRSSIMKNYLKASSNHLPTAYKKAKDAGDKSSASKFMDMIKKQAARKTPQY